MCHLERAATERGHTCNSQCMLWFIRRACCACCDGPIARVEDYCDASPASAKIARTATRDGNEMDEAHFQAVGSTDLPAMNRPTALPVGLIAVLVPKAVLLLMHV